jgi:hypothetical protein
MAARKSVYKVNWHNRAVVVVFLHGRRKLSVDKMKKRIEVNSGTLFLSL